MPKKQLVGEVLIDLHRRLSTLPTRSHERRMIMQETANLYGVSEQTLYRALAQRARPRALRRSDRGTPRVLPQDKMEYYCELIAALKVRTSNKKGRHLSTGEAIRLIEEFGVETVVSDLDTDPWTVHALSAAPSTPRHGEPFDIADESWLALGPKSQLIFSLPS